MLKLTRKVWRRTWPEKGVIKNGEEITKELERRKTQALLKNQERVQEVQQSYRTIEAKSREDNALLLLSVSSTSRPKASAIERCVAANQIIQLEDERNKALHEALLYRNLAKQMRKEKRDTHHKMS